jgi:hypothetical protein
MSRYGPPQYNSAFPPKYMPRQGFPSIPQHVPGPRDGEDLEAYADRLFAIGYTMSDARALAGLPPA